MGIMDRYMHQPLFLCTDIPRIYFFIFLDELLLYLQAIYIIGLA